ncbi:DNA damage-repair/toleration protein DRT100, partial [Linum perenne]
LVGNSFSDTIPPQIGNLNPPPPPPVLNLVENKISGQIPTSFSKLQNLRHLDLSNNHPSGQISSDFGNLKILSRAMLSRNQIFGSIPNSISETWRR